MANADSVSDKLDGLLNSKPLPYREVNLLDEYRGPDSIGEEPNTTPSMFDQITTLAKILTRRHNGKDLFDMVVEIHDAVVK